jgi:hypothetical protein
MKRALIVLLFALTAFAARGAEPAVAEKGVERPNVIEIRGGSTFDVLDGASFGIFFYAEYARHMKGKFWLGGRLGEAYEVMVGDPSAETLHLVLMNYFVTTAYGIGYWEFPVARKWLSFRVGGGVGLGVHAAEDLYRPTVGPYVMVRAEWVVHITRNFGLSLSPLVIGPSQFEFGLAPGRKNGAMKMSGKLDWLGHLGLYVRF